MNALTRDLIRLTEKAEAEKPSAADSRFRHVLRPCMTGSGLPAPVLWTLWCIYLLYLKIKGYNRRFLKMTGGAGAGAEPAGSCF